jgi:hypothetical protein
VVRRRTEELAAREFYFNEARSHMQWTILAQSKGRSEPRRRSAGHLRRARRRQPPASDGDRPEGQPEVRAGLLALDGCYTCHKASAKPFLRPTMPSAPAQGIIDFAP